MNIKKFMAGALVFVMVCTSFMCASCKAEPGSNIKVRTKETEETEESLPDETKASVSETVETTVETDPVPTVTEVPAFDGYEFAPEFDVLYEREMNEAGDTRFLTGKICLSSLTEALYPKLDGAIDAYNEANRSVIYDEISALLPEEHEGMLCIEENITIARSDSKIFSFLAHYCAYTGNPAHPDEGLIYDCTRAYTIDVISGKELGYEDLFLSDLDESGFISEKLGLENYKEVYYLVDYNGIKVIAERDGYDQKDPFSSLIYQEVYTFDNSAIFANQQDFSYVVNECVIRDFGGDLDFQSFYPLKGEKQLSTVFFDPATEKTLEAKIVFAEVENSEANQIDMIVTDLSSFEEIAHGSFSGLTYYPKAYMFCNDGKYILALSTSGYDDDGAVNMLVFDGNGQVNDELLTFQGSLVGTPSAFTDYPYLSDVGTTATICNQTTFFYIAGRRDIMGTYDLLSCYHIEQGTDVVEIPTDSIALTFFGEPMISKIDFDFVDIGTGETVTLPAGSQFCILSVNESTREIHFLSGASVYSLTYDPESTAYMVTVNGTADTDIFETVFYNMGL